MAWTYGAKINFKKPARKVKTVFLHCSASDHPGHDSVAVITRWHIQRGFSGIGYHYFISKNGNIHDGRSLERTPAAQKGHNSGSIAICLHGLKVEKFTKRQYESVKALCKTIDSAYGKKMIRFRGHREVSSKSCPVFDYQKVLGLDGQGKMGGAKNTSSSALRKPATTNTLQLFSAGQKVCSLQKWLTDFGIKTSIDGLFGQGTQKSVMHYQKLVGLQANGIVDSKTMQTMVVVKRGSRGEAVKRAQELLIASNFRIAVDGNFGPISEAATKEFQKLNRLKVDGVIGAKTWGKLYSPTRHKRA